MFLDFRNKKWSLLIEKLTQIFKLYVEFFIILKFNFFDIVLF
ncbi:hypothetical protein SAMN04488541_10436 [Thermoflexibacter ruber]|uniref:Uncharacterized protein n=1 Tax=Thermoflexibacter ruber TaxID=1003 RepID=A0A1I2JAM5_9BACT|nr:hypothetical protein SAMN04488541_10436 [Thermoflexibacter ruber]